MQRLFLKVNKRVVSTVCPLDRTVTQLLHDKPNIDELMANLALAVMDLIHFAQLILQKLCNARQCNAQSPLHLSLAMAAITRPTVERTPLRRHRPARCSSARRSSSTPSPT